MYAVIMVMLLRLLSCDRKRHYVLLQSPFSQRIIRRRKTLNANVCGEVDYHKRDRNEDLTFCMGMLTITLAHVPFLYTMSQRIKSET